MFKKSIVLPFSPYKSIRDYIWPCRKIGQGQSRDIIWANLVVLEHPMMHTKFQGHGLLVPEKIKVFTIYGYGGHLGHVTRTVWANFPHPIDAPYEIWLTDPMISEEKMFKECGRRRTMEAYLTNL